jgi:hypothetical protein
MRPLIKKHTLFIIAFIVGITGVFAYMRGGMSTSLHNSLAGLIFPQRKVGGSQAKLYPPEPPNYTRASENIGSRIYVHPAYNFSFEFPEDLSVSTFKEGGGEIIVAQGEVVRPGAESPEHFAFQIFIMPWDEGGDIITPQRIHQDLPDLPVENPQEALVYKTKRALLFFSEDPAFGRTREIWILHNEFLYQIITADEYDPWLAEIMKTWKFL